MSDAIRTAYVELLASLVRAGAIDTNKAILLRPEEACRRALELPRSPSERTTLRQPSERTALWQPSLTMEGVTYRVLVAPTGLNRLSCDCPYARRTGNVCSHQMAALNRLLNRTRQRSPARVK